MLKTRIGVEVGLEVWGEASHAQRSEGVIVARPQLGEGNYVVSRGHVYNNVFLLATWVVKCQGAMLLLESVR